MAVALSSPVSGLLRLSFSPSVFRRQSEAIDAATPLDKFCLLLPFSYKARFTFLSISVSTVISFFSEVHARISTDTLRHYW